MAVHTFVMLKMVLLTASQLEQASYNDNHEAKTLHDELDAGFGVLLMISDHVAHIPSMKSSMLQQSCKMSRHLWLGQTMRGCDSSNCKSSKSYYASLNSLLSIESHDVCWRTSAEGPCAV